MKKAKKFLLTILSVLTTGLCALGMAGCKETEKGEQGVGIESVEVDEDGNLVITLTDGTTLEEIELPATKACEHEVSSWKIFQQGQTVTTCETALFYGECKDCGEITFKKGATHRFGFGIGVQEATCTSEGYEYQQCSVCGYMKKTNVTEALGHAFGEWVESSAATCEWSGYNVRYCTRVNCSGYEYKTVDALGHDEQDIVVEPTCSTAGYTQHGCTRCTYNRSTDTYVSALGHTVANGKCSRCQKEESTGLIFALVNGTYTLAAIGTCADTDIMIPEKYNGVAVTAIGDRAFEDCGGLTSITIPGSVTSIGSYAFYWCSSLTSIVIPDSVTAIGDRAFEDCGGLTSITIPGSVTSIGSYAFYWCSSLTSVTIPGSVTSIGSYAFYGCSSLTSVTIPDSVTSIGSYAFYWCSSLTSIVIPDSVTSIGEGAFYGCRGLTSVTMGDSVTSIGDGAFDNTGYYNNESNWENGVLYLDGWLLEAKDKVVSGKYTIKAGTVGIGSNAFYNCDYLTSVTIPDSVTSIGGYAFYNCDNLTIYCEAASKPDGWDSNWQGSCSVVWGYKGN